MSSKLNSPKNYTEKILRDEFSDEVITEIKELACEEQLTVVNEGNFLLLCNDLNNLRRHAF